MNELCLFAGIGGGILGGKILGWNTVCAVEIDEYCRKVLLARQREGYLPKFPIWDDVRTFDGKPWRGAIDIVSGGFPCQDISSAGQRKGITGKSSSMFFEMLRIIEEVRPALVFAENSPHLRTNGLSEVIEGLTSLGYMGCHGVLGAWHIGANHRRNRMWILAANANLSRERTQSIYAEVASTPKIGENATNTQGEQMGARGQPWRHISLGPPIADTESIKIQSLRGQQRGVDRSKDVDWWCENRFEGVDDGLANRMDRVRATGNAQVPGVAAYAFCILYETLLGEKNERTS